MHTISTSLSSFFIQKDDIFKIKDELKYLERFSNKEYNFQVQDKINSSLAIIQDCLEKTKTCFELCEKLKILETYQKHKSKSKNAKILRQYNSPKNVLDKCKHEINILNKTLENYHNSLNEIQTDLIKSNQLTCGKCQGKGQILRTKYVRERGSPPQPYTEIKSCKNCNETGKVILESELKKDLSKFIQYAKTIYKRFEIYKNTLSNYIHCYKIPSLDDYYEIESIFPEEDPRTPTYQQSLTKFT